MDGGPSMGGVGDTLPALRAGHLLALLFTLAGLFAMHGLAPTSPAGAQHSPAHAGAAETWELGTSAVPAPGTEGDRHGSHGLMAGCLVVLGAITGALLALLTAPRRHRALATPHGPRRGAGRVAGPPQRPPPRWPAISLGVLRV